MMWVKRFFCFVLIAISLMFCVSCGKGGGLFSGSPVNKFEKAIEENAYADAIAEYNTNIAGNLELEQKAKEVMVNQISELRNDILSGKCSAEDASTKEETIGSVYSKINCKIDNYDDLQNDVKTALASRVAYKSGVSFLQNKDYLNAIKEFQKVIPDDKDYKDAVNKQIEATEKYKEQLKDQVEQFVGANDYLQALSLLKQAAEALPDDADILTELNVCEKNYINSIVTNAETVFTDHTKYQEALHLIQEGLQQYPEDKTLLDKKDYYLGFTPENLYDLDAIRGEASTYDTDTGTYKDEYSKCFWNGYGDWMIYSGDTDITFDIEGKYNRLTATIYGRSTKNETNYRRVTIYGDDKKLYDNTKIKDSGRPFDIEVDITGISDLRIVMDGTGISGGIGITNMLIQKTVK